MNQNPYQPQQPYQQQAHQPPGPGQMPHPQGGYVPAPAPNKDLDDQSLIWLIVGCAGFFFGLGFVTGPLAWIFGSRLRKQYVERSVEPNGMATAAWIVGICTTVVWAMVMVFLAIMFAMMFVFVGAAAAGSI